MLRARFMLYLSLLLALVLAITPLPDWCEPFRPDWALLVLVFWTMNTPERVNIGLAWVMGLIIDLAMGSSLGGHALAFSIAIYLVALHFRKLRTFAMLQQMLVVALLTLLTRLLVFWVAYVVENAHFNAHLLWGIVINMVLWPWLALFLRRWQEPFRSR